MAQGKVEDEPVLCMLLAFQGHGFPISCNREILFDFSFHQIPGFRSTFVFVTILHFTCRLPLTAEVAEQIILFIHYLGSHTEELW